MVVAPHVVRPELPTTVQVKAVSVQVEPLKKPTVTVWLFGLVLLIVSVIPVSVVGLVALSNNPLPVCDATGPAVPLAWKYSATPVPPVGRSTEPLPPEYEELLTVWTIDGDAGELA